MKIAVIFHRLGPYHVARLNALAARCDLTVIELTGLDRTYAWDKVEQGCEFRRVTLFGNLDHDPGQRRELPRATAAALDQARPDAVAAPGWGFPGALAALAWSRSHGVPAVLMSDSQALDHPRTAAKEWLKRRVLREFSSAFVAGKRSADYAAGLGMERAGIFSGYDVVDNRHFSEGAARARAGAAALRAGLGLPERYWLASSRFVPQKDVPLLLRAYARWRAAAGPGAWDLVLLGDGPQKADLLALRAALGLEAAVMMPGFVQYQELPSYYGLAKAFVQASRSEPWGLVVNEAMAAGLPVLISDACGCAPDLVEEGATGALFARGDEDGLVGTMLGLSRRGDAELAAMGARGAERIGHWSPESFADNLLAAAAAARERRLPAFGAASRLLLGAMIRFL